VAGDRITAKVACRISKIREVAALMLVPLLAPALVAEDWPQWRGPNRDGTWNETGIRETFPRMPTAMSLSVTRKELICASLEVDR
jgi:hypothetical protein